jgi:hypothetical protein
MPLPDGWLDKGAACPGLDSVVVTARAPLLGALLAAAEQADVREDGKPHQEPTEGRHGPWRTQGVHPKRKSERGERKHEEPDERENPVLEGAAKVSASEEPQQHQRDARKDQGQAAEQERHGPSRTTDYPTARCVSQRLTAKTVRSHVTVSPRENDCQTQKRQVVAKLPDWVEARCPLQVPRFT